PVVRLTRDQSRISQVAVVRVDKIDKRVIFDSRQNRMRVSFPDLIPAHLRHHPFIGRRLTRPRIKLRPAASPNSSEASNNNCIPTQIPSRGVPPDTRSRTSSSKPRDERAF